MKDIISNRIKKAVYNIPQGYEARIDGNKVIVEAKESEDERIKKELLTHINRLIECHDKPDAERDEKYESWRDWVKEQGEPKYTWTEDEETMLKAIILNLEEVKKHCAIASTQYISKCIDFLKSSLKPLDSWKPTAAQMYSLKEHVTYGVVDDDLRSLYNDLIKLL